METTNEKIKMIIIEKIKILLDMEDTREYDEKLKILVNGAIGTLKKAGVPFIESKNDYFDNYCICLAMEVAKMMDMDFNFENLQRLYLTSVNILRTEFPNEN